MPYNPALKQALKLQQLAFARSQDPKLSHETFSRLTRAFCELDERIRIKKMKPLPKPVEVSLLKKPRKQQPTFTDTDVPPADAPPDGIEPNPDTEL